MPINQNRPLQDAPVAAQTSSIGATPVAAVAVAHTSGYLQRVLAAAGGTTTGTITVAVAVNGGSDITGGGLTIAAGTGTRAGSTQEFPLTGANAILINEGDIITFTPSGGGGASIQGAFVAAIRAI